MYIWYFQEAQLSVDTTKREPFFELNCILEALMRKDLGPALQYVYDFFYFAKLFNLCYY